MPKTKYVIKLIDTERRELLKIIKNGTSPAKVITRVNILLASDSSKGKPLTVAEVAERYNTTATTVQNVRTDYANSGLEGALNRKKCETPPVLPKVDGTLEARIIAISCSDPPDGYDRWTLRLVADRCVELGYVESLSHMTVKRTLKKPTQASPKEMLVHPAGLQRCFCRSLEDILEKYIAILTTKGTRSYAWMKSLCSFWRKLGVEAG